MRSRFTMRRASRLTAGAAALALSLSLAACGGSDSDSPGSSDGKPQQGGVATIDWVADPTSLDPLRYNVFGVWNLLGLTYNTLYRWTEDGELENELASGEAEVSEDGLSVTIPVREGVKFHDGSPLTAEDVAFTIESVIKPENASTWYAALSPITKVEAPDDVTVELTLERRHSVLAGMLAQVPIISADTPYVPTETYARTMNGSGPFKFVEWKQGQQVELERNDDYFVDERPYLDGVIMRTVKEDAGRMANVASGNSDVMPMVPFNQIKALEDRGVNVTVAERSALSPIVFPSMQKGRPTANAAFRQAVAWAIDRGAIVDTVFKGVAEPQSTLMANGTPYWNSEVGGTYGEDASVDKAKKALAEAGVKEGTKLDLIVRNEPLAIATGTVIQANLRDIGLDVSLSPEESASYLPKLLAGDFDLMLINLEIGLTSGYTPMYVYSAMHSESGSNYNKFSDAKLDELMEAAISDPEDPEAAWRAVQEHELNVVPLIPTVTARYVEAYSDRLKGHSPSSLFSLRDLDRAWISE